MPLENIAYIRIFVIKVKLNLINLKAKKLKIKYTIENKNYV